MTLTIINEIIFRKLSGDGFLCPLSLICVEFDSGESVVLVEGLCPLSFSSVEFDTGVVLVDGLDLGTSDGGEVGECGDNVGFKVGCIRSIAVGYTVGVRVNILGCFLGSCLGVDFDGLIAGL